MDAVTIWFGHWTCFSFFCSKPVKLQIRSQWSGPSSVCLTGVSFLNTFLNPNSWFGCLTHVQIVRTSKHDRHQPHIWTNCSTHVMQTRIYTWCHWRSPRCFALAQSNTQHMPETQFKIKHIRDSVRDIFKNVTRLEALDIHNFCTYVAFLFHSIIDESVLWSWIFSTACITDIIFLTTTRIFHHMSWRWRWYINCDDRFGTWNRCLVMIISSFVCCNRNHAILHAVGILSQFLSKQLTFRYWCISLNISQWSMHRWFMFVQAYICNCWWVLCLIFFHETKLKLKGMQNECTPTGWWSV
jgi:hypothetical protein